MGLLSLPLVPAQLLLRALDDLHAVAVAAQDLGPRLDGLEDRFDRIEGEIEEAIGVARQIERRGTDVLGVGERFLELGASIEQRAGAIVALGDSAEALVRAVLAEGERIEAAALEVATTGAELAAALPMLQRAMEMTAPLEGAVERFGRVVDRLPGGKNAPRGRAAAPAVRTTPR